MNLNFKDYLRYLKVTGNKFFNYPKNYMDKMKKKDLMKGYNMLKREIKRVFGK